MAGDEFRVRVHGVDEAVRQLEQVVPKLRRRAVMNALRAGGRVLRDEARRLTPVLRPEYRRSRVRKPGTVRQAISVRTSKRDRRAGNAGVFVNVKPAKGGQRGATSRNDPYYWRWLEFGWRIGGRARTSRGGNPSRGTRGTTWRPGFAMLRGAVRKGLDAVRRFEQSLGPALQKILDRQADR